MCDADKCLEAAILDSVDTIGVSVETVRMLLPWLMATVRAEFDQRTTQ